MRWKFWLLAALYLVLTGFYPVDQSPVIDGADLFSARAENELTVELARFRARTGVALEIVTMRTSDMGGENLRDYACHLFEVRRSNYTDNAPCVLFVATPYAEGGRLEIVRSPNVRATFSPATVSEIGNAVIAERRRTHDMGMALIHGIRATEEAFTTPRPHNSSWSFYDWMIVGVIVIGVLVLLFLFVGWLRSRRRNRGRRWTRRDTEQLGDDLVEAGQAGLYAASDNTDAIVAAGDTVDVSSFGDALSDAASGAIETVGDVASGAADVAGDAISAAGDAISNIDVSSFGDD